MQRRYHSCQPRADTSAASYAGCTGACAAMATHRQCSRADRAAPATDADAGCCAVPGQHLPQSAAVSGVPHRHHCRYGAWSARLAWPVVPCSALASHAPLASKSCSMPQQVCVCAVLANICYQRPNLQTAVHEAGGTYLLLSQCQVAAAGHTLCQLLLQPLEVNEDDRTASLAPQTHACCVSQVDEKSPLTREWAVLATRNLCEGRSDIQAAISELQAVTAGQSEESGGVELSLNAATGKVGVKHGST